MIALSSPARHEPSRCGNLESNAITVISSPRTAADEAPGRKRIEVGVQTLPARCQAPVPTLPCFRWVRADADHQFSAALWASNWPMGAWPRGHVRGRGSGRLRCFGGVLENATERSRVAGDQYP